MLVPLSELADLEVRIIYEWHVVDELMVSTKPWPPIRVLVDFGAAGDGKGRQVLDGMHRLEAARRMGRETIDVEFVTVYDFGEGQSIVTAPGYT